MEAADDRVIRDVRALGPKPRPLWDYSTANLNDAMDRIGMTGCVLDPAIRPVLPFTKMVGVAVTLKLRAADGTGRFADHYARAFEAGRRVHAPILVIESPPDAPIGAMGSGGAYLMKNHYGFVGCLLEGAVRDTDDLRSMGFQVYARLISPRHAGGHAEGVSVEEPVVVGGVTIHPGDFIVADNDGVVVIPKDELPRVQAAVDQDLRNEADLIAEIDRGEGSYLEIIRKYMPKA